MNARRPYLVSYDVPDSKRQRAIRRRVRGYARDGQKSVYECWFSEAQKRDVLADLALILEMDFDRLLLIALDNRQTKACLGLAETDQADHFYWG